MTTPSVMPTKVPYIDLAAEYRAVQEELDPVVQRVLASGAYTLGPEVSAFEREIAAFCRSPHAVSVASGTDALEFALRAAGIAAGDEVLVPAMTFIATAEAVAHCGARPVFVDIDAGSYTLDVEHAAARITPKTRAILPVHLYGHPCAMDAVMALARRHGLIVVEDCAQAIEASVGGRLVGTFGTAGAFSFFPTKNLGACGDGGLVITEDTAVQEHVRMLRMHGSLVRDDHRLLGRTGRLDELQAAILRVKLRHLPAWTEARRRLAQVYTHLLCERLTPHLPGLRLPTEAAGVRHVYHIYAVRVPHRDRLVEFLHQQGIGALVHYSRPVHLQPVFAASGARPGDCPAAESLAREVLSLPIYPTMPDSAVEQVVDAMARFYHE